MGKTSVTLSTAESTRLPNPDATNREMPCMISYLVMAISSALKQYKTVDESQTNET